MEYVKMTQGPPFISPYKIKTHISDLEIGTGKTRRFVSIIHEYEIPEQEKERMINEIITKMHKKHQEMMENLYNSMFYGL